MKSDIEKIWRDISIDYIKRSKNFENLDISNI